MAGTPSDLAEIDLVREAKGGDLAAYAQLLRAHEPVARRLALYLCGDEGDDATQDAFVKAWRSLHTYREESPFGGWLLRIVANESRNRARARGRRRGYELRFAEDRSLGRTPPSPEVAAVAADARRTLRAAVDTLPEPIRDVVVSRHLIGLSEAETAAALDIPLGTVKSRLARGLDRLRGDLAGVSRA